MILHRNLFVLVFFVGACLSAQVSFKAVPNKTTAKVGERIQLSFILTTSQDLEFNQITFPSFSGFQMLGRNVGQNFSYTNGRMTKQYMETVILMPQKPGEFTIQGGVVIIDGEKYHSNPVTFKIMAADPKPDKKEEHLVFMEVVLDKNDVYPNENIHAVIKLYAKSFDALRRRTDLEVPGMSDFQVREISKNQDRNFEQELINNEVYISENIAEYQLTPTATGDLVIPAFTLRVVIPLGFFDEKVLEVKTNHRTVFVNEFPPNAPASFQGAVGNFRLNTHLDNASLSVNESAEYEIELIGTGNFSSINLPKIKNPKDIEVYPSKTRNAFQTTLSGEKGKMVDRYVLVPQYGGKFEIPSIEFCFFDPNSKTYKRLYTDPEVLNVNGQTKEDYLAGLDKMQETDSLALEDAQGENNIISELPKELTSIFKRPKTESPVLSETQSSQNFWWYAGLGLPLLAGLLWFFFVKNPKKRKATKDSNGNSKRTISQQLKTDLNQLNQMIQASDAQGFLRKYQETLNRLVIYHHGVDQQYAMMEAREILSEKVSTDFASRWETLFKQIQTMSYGIAPNDLELQSQYDALKILIKESLKL